MDLGASENPPCAATLFHFPPQTSFKVVIKPSGFTHHYSSIFSISSDFPRWKHWTDRAVSASHITIPFGLHLSVGLWCKFWRPVQLVWSHKSAFAPGILEYIWSILQNQCHVSNARKTTVLIFLKGHHDALTGPESKVLEEFPPLHRLQKVQLHNFFFNANLARKWNVIHIKMETQ